MNVLIQCEKSQVVCKAFRERGHNAFSNDIYPAEGGHPEWHFKMDAFEARRRMYQKFGLIHLIIAHPECKFLCHSGVRWLAGNEFRWHQMKQAAAFFKRILEQPFDHPGQVDRIVVENSVPHGYAVTEIGCKYDQIIQPYQFGHPEKKKTCLWLRGVSPLIETDNVKKEMLLLPNKLQAKTHYIRPGPERSALRANTLPGIAHAMAEQWG